jgi:hypothetical protein
MLPDFGESLRWLCCSIEGGGGSESINEIDIARSTACRAGGLSPGQRLHQPGTIPAESQ